MDQGTIRFTIKGPAIHEPYPLKDLIVLLENFHSLIDQSYLALSGKKKMSRAERLNYQILASLPKQGSYEQELMIAAGAVQTVLPLFMAMDPATIWKNAKAAFDFLKTLNSLRSQGKQPSLSAPDNQGTVLFNTGDNNPIVINQTIFQTAERSEPIYKEMSSHIEEGRIDGIFALDREQKGIALGMEEKALFIPETFIDEVPVDVLGEVYDFNKDSLSGRVHALPESDVPQRDYPFQVIGSQDTVPYIMAMTKPRILMRCLPEILIRATGSRVIMRLQSLSIQDV